jgi:hypothetical protein
MVFTHARLAASLILAASTLPISHAVYNPPGAEAGLTASNGS